MEEKKVQPTTVEQYIAQYPEEIQKILVQLRALILESAPGAKEKISYQMPGFFINGGVVWFGVYKRHIGLYPITPAVEAAFQGELEPYRGTKSALHFPLDQPMPYELIARIVKVRVEENQKK